MTAGKMTPAVIGTPRFGRGRAGVPEAGGWLQAPRDRAGLSLLDRMGAHSQSAFGSSSMHGPSGMRVSNPFRLLTFDQLRLIYQRCSDVRSSIDSIVRRVATWDRLVEPTVSPRDDRYEALLGLSAEVGRFLDAPNTDGEAWQEWATKLITDLLIYDSGISENVLAREAGQDVLREMVALRGASTVPITDEFGRVLFYEQAPHRNMLGGSGGSDSSKAVRFDPTQILHLRLFPNTEGPEGFPLIESIVNEVITILRANEHAMLAMDADEIPPGILVLSGLAKQAANEAKADLKNMKGQDHKIRVMATSTPGVGASWVELRRTPKDLSMIDVVKGIRRAIWRTFGVMPVEHGDTEGMPRATAQAQLDVSSSHLLTPILDLVEAKINTRILPLLVQDQELLPLIRFRFDRERDLTPVEFKAKVDAYTEMVDRAVITRNEMRAEFGHAPSELGDVATVVTKTVPLDFALENPEPPAPNMPQGAGDDPGNPDPDSGGDDEETAPEDESEEAPGESGEDARSTVPFGVNTHSPECGPGCRHVAETRTQLSDLAEDLPSAWQDPNGFEELRVVDLPALWREVAGYAADVNPLWDAASLNVQTAIASGYKQEGMTEEDRTAIMEQVDLELTALAEQWRRVTAPRYQGVTAIARDTAELFSGNVVLDDWLEIADRFQDGALSHAVSRDGIIGTVRNRIALLLSATVDVRAREGAEHRGAQKLPKVSATAPVDDVLDIAEQSFISNKHRIAHYSGKTIELGYAALNVGLNQQQTREDVAAAFFGDEEAARRTGLVEWYVEWVTAGGRVCPTCADQESRGWIPMRHLGTVPGGDTQCGGRCRCVLVYWTRDEIGRGDAFALNDGPKDPIDAPSAPPAGSPPPPVSGSPASTTRGPVRVPADEFDTTPDGRLILNAEAMPDGAGGHWYRVLPEGDDSDVWLRAPVADLFDDATISVDGTKWALQLDDDFGKQGGFKIRVGPKGDGTPITLTGSFDESFSLIDDVWVPNGTGTLTLDSIDIPAHLRGAGFERDLFKGIADLARRGGVSEIKLSAGIRGVSAADRPTLALLGFDFEDAERLAAARVEFGDYLRTEVGLRASVVDDILPTLEHAWDFALLSVDDVAVGRKWLASAEELTPAAVRGWVPTLSRARDSTGLRLLDAYAEGSAIKSIVTSGMRRLNSVLLMDELDIENAFVSLLQKTQLQADQQGRLRVRWNEVNWSSLTLEEQRVYSAIAQFTIGPNHVVRDLDNWLPFKGSSWTQEFKDGVLEANTTLQEMVDANHIMSTLASRETGEGASRLAVVRSEIEKLKLTQTAHAFDDAAWAEFFEVEDAALIFRGAQLDSTVVKGLGAGDDLDFGSVSSWSLNPDESLIFSSSGFDRGLFDLEDSARVVFAVRDPERGTLISSLSQVTSEVEYIASGKARIVKKTVLVDSQGDRVTMILMEFVD